VLIEDIDIETEDDTCDEVDGRPRGFMTAAEIFSRLAYCKKLDEEYAKKELETQ
jgi:hypothetical protein